MLVVPAPLKTTRDPAGDAWGITIACRPDGMYVSASVEFNEAGIEMLSLMTLYCNVALMFRKTVVCWPANNVTVDLYN